ncbi:hypothetical protein M8J75_004133 [Diaphorina citri]|nr:hypothetical protein M8J75_004133 [Diaphorina citri]
MGMLASCYKLELPVVHPVLIGEVGVSSDVARALSSESRRRNSNVVFPNKVRGKRRGGGSRRSTNMNGGALDVQNNNSIKQEVKSERLSPNIDANSSSPRSNTPSSSYPGTPPGMTGADRGSSPSSSSSAAAIPPHGTTGPHLKNMEQMMNRNYSDFMRSLAAKYNNSNPNDYFSSTQRNGFGNFNSDSRFSAFKPGNTPPFGLMTPSSGNSATPNSNSLSSVNAKDSSDISEPNKAATPSEAAQQAQLFSNLAAGINPFTSPNVPGAIFPNLGTNVPVFPQMVDMSSTQALLSLVRSASAQSANQLENYLKGANKRSPPGEPVNNPIDLSSNAPLPKKSRKSQPSLNDFYTPEVLGNLGIPFLNQYQKSLAQNSKPFPNSNNSNHKRSGSESPKPRPNSRLSASPIVRSIPCISNCSSGDKTCSEEARLIAEWNVDEVCNFVSSIELCAEYAPVGLIWSVSVCCLTREFFGVNVSEYGGYD